jgi:hypothetical protein
MSPRTTGILVLIAAALGAFVYFYEIRGADSRKEAEELKKRLFAGVEPGAIEWIALKSPAGPEARLERREGKWRLTAPVDFPADTYAADNLASTLATLSSETILESPQPPEEYGLGDAARVVRFSAGGKEYELRLGKDTPVGGGAYASVGGMTAVFDIARYKASTFDKKPDDLRDKRILDFDKKAVSHIEASWPGGRVVLDRETVASAGAAGAEKGAEAAEPAEAGWRLTAPIQGRADSDTVENLLTSLSFLRAEGFVDDPPDDAQAGLAPPAYEIALTSPGEGEGAQPRVVRLAVGAERPGALRLVRGAQHSLYTIQAGRFEELPRKLSAWRWKQLARFAAADAHAIDFFFQPPKGDPVAIHAEHGDTGWTSTPEAFAAGKLDGIVAELSRLHASDIAADSMGEKELRGLGLSPPNAIITVFGKAPEAPAAKPGESGEGEEKPALPVLAEVQIGNIVGSEWIAARAAGDPTVYELPHALADQLPVSLDAFRNRFKAAEGEAAKPAEPAPPAGGNPDFLPPGDESP